MPFLGHRNRTAFSRRNQVARIVRLVNRATPSERLAGMEWYRTANALANGLATGNGYTIEQTAGVIAALSPQVSWERNVIMANLAVTGKRYSGQTYRNIAKARAILEGEDVADVLGAHAYTGMKVRNFFACIAYYDTTNAVCIDRHALAAAEGYTGSDQTILAELNNALRRRGGYEDIAESYREASAILGIRPHQAQAIAWTVWRELIAVLYPSDSPSDSSSDV